MAGIVVIARRTHVEVSREDLAAMSLPFLGSYGEAHTQSQKSSIFLYSSAQLKPSLKAGRAHTNTCGLS